jgi:hypothetical protein
MSGQEVRGVEVRKMTDVTMHALGQTRGTPVLAQIADFFAGWAAARNCAAALEFGRRPANDDLRRVGIDPKAFARIRLS